jgi:hypothetical protein
MKGGNLLRDPARVATHAKSDTHGMLGAGACNSRLT